MVSKHIIRDKTTQLTITFMKLNCNCFICYICSMLLCRISKRKNQNTTFNIRNCIFNSSKF